MEANSLYRIASLFDGPYDGERVRSNPFRRVWNLSIDVILKLVFLSHLVVFLSDNECLRNELVYLKYSNSFGYRYLNFG